MSSRCLLFSSKQDTVPPIMQVLSELGIEGEHCASGVDAVEKVTTLLFQIVITDWDDQPEAAFLLKTAKDLKAAQRPLTLAIVGDDQTLPQALQAGANSVLVKPLRIEQLRDTMTTACALLRAKQQPATKSASIPNSASPPVSSAPKPTPEFDVMAAAPENAVSAPPSLPLSVTQMPENTFRPGEFLQPQDSAPSAEFDTEKSEGQKSLDEAAVAEMDALTDLEPTAAAVRDAATEPAQSVPAQPATAEDKEPLTGWAALQARLNKSAPQPPAEKPEKPAQSEMLSYGDVQSYVGHAPATAPASSHPAESPAQEAPAENEHPAKPEAVSADVSSEPDEHGEPAEPAVRSRHGRFVAAAVLAACVVFAIVPQTRQSLRRMGQSAMRAGKAWLNPPPAALPQTVAQHDNFSQAGDEYKLPTPTNIPDATTDPSQIRVVPVVDPTAKPDKNAAANGGSGQPADGSNSNPDQPQAPSAQGGPTNGENTSGQGNASPPAADTTTPAAAPANGPAAPQPAGPVSAPVAHVETPSTPTAAQPQPTPPATAKPSPLHTVSASMPAGIPQSLKSQMAPNAPAAGGVTPPEAAMSTIEPVNLPQTAVLDLLAQRVDPAYPANANGQRGSVVLQVLIGRDGAVQDAKFLQGSLMFARAAIDAVKQWRFKPYSMNGRAVSVQTSITLNFAPPA